MLRKTITFLFIIILLAGSVYGEGTENAITLFDGGKNDFNFSMYSQLVSGAGLDLGYASTQPWNIWANPASVATFSQSYVAMGFQPPMILDLGSLADINNEIPTNVDDALKDFKTPETKIFYPTVGANAGLNGGLYGMQVVLARESMFNLQGKDVFYFKIGQPFYMDLHFQNNGLQTMLQAKFAAGDDEKQINLRLNARLKAALQIQATKFNFGWGTQISDNLAAGLSIGQTRVDLFFDGIAKLDGMMEMAGTEYAFNDPYDPRIDFANGETNKLDQAAFVDFDGKGINTNLGLLYKAGSSWVFGIDYEYQAPITMKGDMSVAQYKLGGLNMEAFGAEEEEGEEGPEILDATMLDLSKLTLTEKANSKTSDELVLDFPSSLGLQASYQGRFFEATVSFDKYIGSFGYDFVDDRSVIELNYGVALQLALGTFQINLGGLNGELVHEVNDILENADTYWVPHGSLAYSFFPFKFYQVSTKLFVSPTPGLAIKLGRFF